MQSKIQVFTNEKFGSVRTTVIDGKLRFAGMDVAVVPEYSNPPRPVRNQIDDANRTMNDSFTVNEMLFMQVTIPHRLEAARQRFDNLYAQQEEVL